VHRVVEHVVWGGGGRGGGGGGVVGIAPMQDSSVLNINSLNRNSCYMNSVAQIFPFPPFTVTCIFLFKTSVKASRPGRSYAHYLPNDSCRNRSQAPRGGFQCCQTGRGHSH
jgi:hypothetical protein